MPDPSGFPEILGVWKETERNDRDINHHQKHSDRIVVARIRIVFHSFQCALQSSKLVERTCQYDQDVFADELFSMQVAHRIVLPVKNEGLLVAPMRNDLLQFGI